MIFMNMMSLADRWRWPSDWHFLGYFKYINNGKKQILDNHDLCKGCSPMFVYHDHSRYFEPKKLTLTYAEPLLAALAHFNMSTKSQLQPVWFFSWAY